MKLDQCSKKQLSPTTAEYQPADTNSRNPSTNHSHSIWVQPIINVVPQKARSKFYRLFFSVDIEGIETSKRNLDATSRRKATVSGMTTTLHAKWCA
jgi:hypothetical protein